MKKKITLVALVTAIVLCAIVAVLALRADKMVAAYKPHISKALSAGLGAQVTLGELRVTVFPAPAISVDRIDIGAGSKLPGQLKVAKVAARLAITPLFLGRISVSSIIISEPELSLTSPQHTTHLPKLQQNGKDALNKPISEEAPAASSSLPFTVAVEEVIVSNGIVRLAQSGAQKAVTIDNINLTSRVQLVESVLKVPSLRLRARLARDLPINAHLSECSFKRRDSAFSCEQYTLNGPLGSVSGSASFEQGGMNGAIKLSGEDISLEKVMVLANALRPDLTALRAAGDMRIALEVKLDSFVPILERASVLFEQGSCSLPGGHQITDAVGTLSATGPLSDLRIDASNLKLSYNGAPIVTSASARLKPSQLTLLSLAVKAFKGSGEFPLVVSLGDGEKTLSGKLLAQHMNVTDLVSALRPGMPAFARGELESMRAELSTVPLSNPENSEAQVSIRLTDGALLGLNFANELLTKVSGLPFIEESLRRKVPVEFEPILRKPDTTVKRLDLSARAQGGKAVISELQLSSELFELSGRGEIDNTADISLQLEVTLDRTLSLALIARAKELKALANTDERLRLPVVVQGRPPKLVVLPDVPAIIKKAATGNLQKALEEGLRGGKGVGKGLRKIFGF